MKILVTGVAGFIGFHVAKTLVKKGYKVIGLDNINEYFEVIRNEDGSVHVSMFNTLDGEKKGDRRYYKFVK